MKTLVKADLFDYEKASKKFVKELKNRYSEACSKVREYVNAKNPQMAQWWSGQASLYEELLDVYPSEYGNVNVEDDKVYNKITREELLKLSDEALNRFDQASIIIKKKGE